jgi:hypothetical protein
VSETQLQDPLPKSLARDLRIDIQWQGVEDSEEPNGVGLPHSSSPNRCEYGVVHFEWPNGVARSRLCS